MANTRNDRAITSIVVPAAAGFVLGVSLTWLSSWWRQQQQPSTTIVAVTKANHSDSQYHCGGRLDDKDENHLIKEPTRKIPIEIREEQLSRHILYFGDDGMRALQESKICIVGLGGVGSHTGAMLARAGVGYLRFIDFDQVTLSSLNRHACATLNDVGIPKVVCLARHCRQICPDPDVLQMDIRVAMYTVETGPQLLDLNGDQWDYVVDAIDDVPTKAALLAYCVRNKIRVISCMGAGGKSDPTRLHLSDMRTPAKDPLATRVRYTLKKLLPTVKDDTYLDDMNVLTVLYNSEKTVEKLADLTEQQKQQGAHNFGAVDGMRVRVLPVLGTMPAIMGQALACHVVTQVGGKPIVSPMTGERVGRNVRNRLWQHLMAREESIRKRIVTQAGLAGLPPDDDLNYLGKGFWIDLSTGVISRVLSNPASIWIGPVQVDQDDVEYIMQVWRNRCAITNARLGNVLHLVRWDLRKPSTCDNLVLISLEALKKYDSPENDWQNIPSVARDRIESRLKTVLIDEEL